MSVHLASTLERCIPDILAEWSRRARGGAFETIGDADRVGHLAEVLHAMSGALAPPGPDSHAVDDFIETAAAHGARRHAQGVHEDCLFEEYDHLGAAVPQALRDCDGASLSPDDLIALEGGLTTAILAGLRGFHRGEFERRGSWTETLARAATEAAELAPLPSPRPSGSARPLPPAPS